MNRLRPTLHSPHQRGERLAGMTPLHASGAGRNTENIEKMLDKPEQGKPESGSADRLSRERDQHFEEQRSASHSNAEQVARGIESGQLDTDLRNTPGVERVVRKRQAANRDDSGRQVANRSADDLAHERGQTGGLLHSRNEHKG